jgi:hypothetical protein
VACSSKDTVPIVGCERGLLDCHSKVVGPRQLQNVKILQKKVRGQFQFLIVNDNQGNVLEWLHQPKWEIIVYIYIYRYIQVYVVICEQYYFDNKRMKRKLKKKKKVF